MFIKQFTSKTISEDSTIRACGGKGHKLIEMHQDGYNVPPGLVITTEACKEYRKLPESKRGAFMNKLWADINPILKTMYKDVNHGLVSVRSSGAISMPGMMDTVLNVGAGYHGNGITSKKKLHEDCKKRFVDMFLNVVEGIDRKEYLEDLDDHYVDFLEVLHANYKNRKEIILACVRAVFDSWDNERAVHYRNMHDINHEAGTAVVIQSMVFGNLNKRSASGVIFSRNPDTGADTFYGDWLPNSQGEDVVAGTEDTFQISKLEQWNADVYSELTGIAKSLEAKHCDVQDVEWTVQDGRTYILQTRNGARSAIAEARIAWHLWAEGITESISDRLRPGILSKTLIPTLPSDFDAPVAAQGIPAGGHLATGKMCTSVQQVLDCTGPAILVAEETTPDDIKGMEKAEGILTSKGGATSHAAVVARAMNKPCIVGCTQAETVLNVKFDAYILIDGQTGNVYLSSEPFDIDLKPELDLDLFSKFLGMINTTPYTVHCDSFQEAAQLAGYVEKVSVPVDSFDAEHLYSQINTLEEKFQFALIRDGRSTDKVADFLGTPITKGEELRHLIDAWIKSNDLKFIKFDGGDDVDPANVLRPYETVADILNPDFVGLVTDKFVNEVMGGVDAYVKMVETFPIGDRVVEPAELFEMIESEIGIG